MSVKCAVRVVGFFVICGFALSCGGGGASRVVSELRARAGSPLGPGLAERFEAGPNGISARFARSNDERAARVVFPAQANGRVQLEDADTGTAITFRLSGARAVKGETGEGYVAYPGAHSSGGTVLHRALPSGTEDFVVFDRRPEHAEVTYEVTLGPKVAGLRLVEETLELLDKTGTPRLRVAPPFVVGTDGAKTDAKVAVEGCKVDTNPIPFG